MAFLKLRYSAQLKLKRYQVLGILGVITAKGRSIECIEQELPQCAFIPAPLVRRRPGLEFRRRCQRIIGLLAPAYVDMV